MAFQTSSRHMVDGIGLINVWWCGRRLLAKQTATSSDACGGVRWSTGHSGDGKWQCMASMTALTNLICFLSTGSKYPL
uniref:Uncharacterized protein n=1 Tax=Rhizophora mucronata TaxID=61149 RepID=A0A2P2N2F9_RHIMU